MAQSVVDAGAVAYLAPLILSPDAKLKRQVCAALGQVAKHSVDLAEVVVEAEIFPSILMCLKDVDGFVRKHAATAVREVCKHTPELAQLVVSNGGVAALVDYVDESGEYFSPFYFLVSFYFRIRMGNENDDVFFKSTGLRRRERYFEPQGNFGDWDVGPRVACVRAHRPRHRGRLPIHPSVRAVRQHR